MRALHEERAAGAVHHLTHSVVLSAFDLKIHGPHPLSGSLGDILHETHRQVSHLPPPPRDVHLYTNFIHLIGYGSSYYAYLYCRASAAAIWRRMFVANPLSAQAGQRLRDEVLRHGNAVPPRRLLTQLIGGEPDVTDLMRLFQVAKD